MILDNLAIILTARSGSERLPNKAMLDVAGYPLIYWIARRLSSMGNVVLMTTDDDSDDILASYVSAMGIPVHRSASASQRDVVKGIDEAVNKFYPYAEYVLRGLGDCPFLCGELVERATNIMDKYYAEAFVWALQPWVSPVYGCREFPYSRNGWQKIVAGSRGDAQCMEHSDRYFALHRDEFNVVYHEPPASVYFRDYRLEIDYYRDLEMLRALATKTAVVAQTKAVIEVLDKHPDIALINHECVEKTGLSCYSYKQKREWARLMRNKPIVGWDNVIWKPPTGRADLIHCDSGQCWLGFAEHGVLTTRAGDQIRGDALLKCKCGAGKRWNG